MDNNRAPGDFYTFQAPFGGRSERGFRCANCDRVFATTRTIDNHERACKSTKRTLSSMLEETKALWEARKRLKTAGPEARLGSSPGVPITSAGSSSQPKAKNAFPNEELPLGVGLGQNELIAEQERSQDHGSSSTASEHGPLPEERDRVPTVLTSPPVDDTNEPIATRKGNRRLPKRHHDDPLPEPIPRPKPCVQDATPSPENGEWIATREDSMLTLLAKEISDRNTFGIDRAYTVPAGSTLTHDPDGVVTLLHLTDTPSRATAVKRPKQPQFGPFENRTSFSLADWYWHSQNKSFSDFQKLISIFRDPGFNIEDAVSVNWKDAFTVLGANKSDLPDVDAAWIQDDGWKSTPINIQVPFHKKMKDKGTETFFIGNLRHRSILSVIREKILNKRDAQYFHYYPYRSTWQPTDDSPEVDLYGELYASQAFRDAHEDLQRNPYGDLKIERVVVALMFWSDSTHLTQFGSASLWPCYLFFGNESKYRRCKPSEGLCHQIAYFQKMPDAFTDFLKERNGGKMPTDAFFSHCMREVFHAQWSILLDKELVNAMKDGERIVCPDGTPRLFFPRIFTYSADYPEKVLIAGTRPNGLFPCPRCLIAKGDMNHLGAPTDHERLDRQRDEAQRCREVEAARVDIFDNGYAVDGTAIEARLKPLSLVPTENAFSKALEQFSYSIFPSLVVDLMHEFEIGVWKRLFIHLLRLLEVFASPTGPTLTAELDARYRATPTFGRDGIRKFGTNTSAMKRKAARDFEDLLQCAIPAFESLLPEPHNSTLMRLLFICAQWHALAKLRLHNDLTLGLLDYTTFRLGAQMREFDSSTSTIPTKELAKEAEARARRDGKGKGTGSASRKPAKLGMYTIKWHFLGDYSSMIRTFGTTDSYTTEVGELSHRLPKSWYGRTDKKDYEDQMTQIERRQARLAAIRADLSGERPSSNPDPDFELFADSRYTIGASHNRSLDLNAWFLDPFSGTIHQDKYLVDFIPKLKQHLLPHLLELLGFEPDPDSLKPSDWMSVAITDNRIYTHKILRSNYTTYNVRREEDVIHVDTAQSNIMAQNESYGPNTWATEHPYTYARVLGVFHVNASFVGILPDGTYRFDRHRIEFLWVHWYVLAQTSKELSLDRVVPSPLDDSESVGFMDPADVLRGVHLIPQFTLGKLQNVRSRIVKTDELWSSYYVNRFADRDMFMRFQYGMSVGHTYMIDDFPPAKVPALPGDFDFHCLGNGSASEADHEEDLEDAGLGQGCSSLEDMDERELMVFHEMYGANGEIM